MRTKAGWHSDARRAAVESRRGTPVLACFLIYKTPKICLTFRGKLNIYSFNPLSCTYILSKYCWYSPEMMCSHHSLLFKYQSIVTGMPVSKVYSGCQPSSVSIFVGSIA